MTENDGEYHDQAAAPEMAEDEADMAEAGHVDLTELRDEIAAANAESRRQARRTADVLKQFGAMLDAMSGTLQDLHRAARAAASTTPAAAESPTMAGATREPALGLIELADRLGRIAAAFARPPEAGRSVWPAANKALAAWQSAWNTQENAFAIVRLHLDDMLRRAGLERLQVVGQPFDPAVMTAVEAVTDAVAADHTVLAELLPGWRHSASGAIVRAAQVRVSRR